MDFQNPLRPPVRAHVERVLKAHRPQLPPRLAAPRPALAVEKHHLLLALHPAVDRRLDLAERQIHRPRQMPGSELARAAHVQHQRAAPQIFSGCP